jgi:hypothetical protein
MKFYEKLELLTRRKYFYLLLTIIPVILPPITGRGLGYLFDLGNFSYYVAGALFDYKTIYAHWMPALHGAILIAIILLLIFRKKVGRAFALFVALNFIVSVYTQATVKTDLYGRVVLTEIFLWYSIVIVLWFWEMIIQKTDYSFQYGLRPWWLLPLALLAFWDPDQAWNLSLSFFIYGFSPTAFCMLTPIYLSVLMFSFPHVNLPLIRIQSYIGLVIGFISLFISFIQSPSAGLYWVLLHTPLILVSYYVFTRSFHYRSPTLAITD